MNAAFRLTNLITPFLPHFDSGRPWILSDGAAQLLLIGKTMFRMPADIEQIIESAKRMPKKKAAGGDYVRSFGVNTMRSTQVKKGSDKLIFLPNRLTTVMSGYLQSCDGYARNYPEILRALKMETLLNPISSEALVLDIGANSGETGLALAVQNRGMHVIAFEPVPEMVDIITGNYHKAVEQHGPITNYSIVKAAVSDFDGDTVFNVAGQADWGCSSLNTFSDGLEQSWPGRTDFKVTQQIPVRVIRLDTFFKAHRVNLLAYMHCDTQGSDLKVLAGMGEYRSCLMKGVIECASSRSVALYKEQHTIEDVVIDFLKWGFEIDRITGNDQFFNEVNVTFTNRFVRPRLA